MDNDIKQSFDYIHAEAELKDQTMIYLKNILDNNIAQKKQAAFYRYIPAACILLCLCIGLFSYNLYFTPVGYVSVDVNPSVEITLNRFEKVIETNSFNPEGEVILSNLQLKYCNYNDAVKAIIESMTESGYIFETDLISVTFQTDLLNNETKMKSALETDVLSIVTSHHLNAEIEVMSVDSETVSGAHAENLSSGKYLAILKLKEVDSYATFENCRNHSIGQLRELTQSHHDEGNYNSHQSNHSDRHNSDHKNNH